MERISVKSGAIHFVGIGGIGMSGIADIMINLGYKVSGSDLKENALTAKLARKGAAITIGHRSENVHGVVAVVISSAVPKDNPEIIEARKLQIPVVKRAEMLAELMRMKLSIAVAGTHGKTTTTSMIAALLDQANMDPTVINGGVINAYNSNARLGTGDWMVVEADESDGSFTKLMPAICIVTNIDQDHVDNFKDFSELADMFLKFVENIPFYGSAILCIDHPEVRKLSERITDRRVITYGFSENVDIRCYNIFQTRNGIEFDVKFSDNAKEKFKLAKKSWEKLALPMFGNHNAQNSLAAIAAALELGISENNIRIALSSFMGVKRRFTKVASSSGIIIIDDYAHHPAEISAVLKAARQSCLGKIFAVMQPHRYTRLKRFLDDFARTLEFADKVLVTPIYTAGEKENGVNHFSLIEKINERKLISAEFSENIEALYEKLSHKLSPGDMVIFLGAGDITKWAYKFGEKLNSNPSFFMKEIQ